MVANQSLPPGLEFDLAFDASKQVHMNTGADDTLSQVDALFLNPQRQRLDDGLSSSNADKTYTMESPCDCLGQASALLEKWEEWKHKPDVDGTVGLLASQKQTMSVCNALLDCKRCGRVSSSMMLPLTICRHLVNFFQSIASGNMSLNEPYQCTVSSGSRTYTNKESSPRSQFYSLGNYHIDSLQEWRHVVAVLVLFQWKELQKLLRRSKKVASSANWETQLLIIESLEGCLRDLVSKKAKVRTQHEAMNT